MYVCVLLACLLPVCILYVYGCFVCANVCVPLAHLVPMESRRGLVLDLLEEQSVLWSAISPASTISFCRMTAPRSLCAVRFLCCGFLGFRKIGNLFCYMGYSTTLNILPTCDIYHKTLRMGLSHLSEATKLASRSSCVSGSCYEPLDEGPFAFFLPMKDSPINFSLILFFWNAFSSSPPLCSSKTYSSV